MNNREAQSDDLKKLRSRINWFCDNKINAFSPTISPAPKSKQRNEIESIYEGIRYFIGKGITELVIQKKYMGSYCDIYLHKEPEATYFVSRNGHRIQHIDLEAAIAACADLHSRFDWNGLSLVIIQAELMPWGVLGQGLIDNEFEGYLNAHQNHWQHLSRSGLYDKMEGVKNSPAYLSFMQDKLTLGKQEFKRKYPSHVIRQYNALEEFQLLDLQQYKRGIDIYEEQILHFGKREALHFKPFNILKKVFDDGKEQIVNDNCSYNEVNDDEMLQLMFDNPENIETLIDTVYNWFATLSGNKEEGIVIKPRQAFIDGLPPAFKVRNNHYLTMIYGVHFLKDLDDNIHKRSIGRKMQCSINDWMINRQLLQIPYREINNENYHLKNLVFDRIMGEKVESGLDSRL